jgi:aspartyl-tRNA(Asn)/glutamyl-tRNA(Gln) amidotransferase subunit C
MITSEDIKKLADLARIRISDVEAEGLTSEIDSILNYVGQIKGISGDEKDDLPLVRNVMRDDIVTHTPGEFTKDLFSSAPESEKGYLKVKKILG